jgi:hypothetical protein
MSKRLYKKEVLCRGIMVDVEAAGPTPARYPLLSIGACVVGQPNRRYYDKFFPDFSPPHTDEYREAMNVNKLHYLTEDGPRDGDMYVSLTIHQDGPRLTAEALTRFMYWVNIQIERPLFVAHNAAFDWMFIATYLDKYKLKNTFGHWPFDTKSAYGNIMTSPIPHHAGEDAYIQTMDLRRFYGLT